MPILKKSNRYHSGGYSLMEIVFVIAMTGILAGISVPSLIHWKHLQDVRTIQLALKTNLEQMKSDAKRWGAMCTINGGTLKSSCESAVFQKSTTDKFSLQSSQEYKINPTVTRLKENKAGNLVKDDTYFVATNFKTITFSPRGFIHVEPINSTDQDAIFVLGYQKDKDPYQMQAPELCVIVQNLTGQINIKQRKLNKISTADAISAVGGLKC